MASTPRPGRPKARALSQPAVQKSNQSRPGDATVLLFQEIRQQLLPLFCKEALMMVLHTFERPRLMANAHDLILVCPGDHLVLARQGSGPDNEAVVPRGREGVGHAGVD